MKKQHVPILIIGNIVLVGIISFLFSFYFVENNKTSIFYVDNVKLFNGFNMSKDLGKVNNKKIDQQRKKLDSLYTVYSIFSEQKNEEKAKETEIILKKEDLELRRMNEYFSNEVSQQVWNRLNTYIEEYGKTKKHTIILGTQGNGNIMFAQEGIDITKKVLEYANNKYEGN